MNQEKIKAYFQMWSEAWKVFKKLSEKYQDDDSFWQYGVKEGEEFYLRYKGTDCGELAKQIMIDVLEEFQRVALAERGDE